MPALKNSAMGDLLTVAVIFFAATLIGAMCLVVLRPHIPEADGEWLNLIVYCVQFAIAIVCARIYYGRRAGGKIKDVGSKKYFRFSFNWYNAPLTLWGLVLVTAAGVVLEPVLDLFPVGYFERLNDAIGSGGVAVFLLVIIAPVCEEIFFRGLVLEQLGRRWSAVWAVVASSLLFGIVHLPIWPQVVNAAVMGMVFGYIYMITRSLMPVIIIHAINNGIAYLVLELTGAQNTGLRELVASEALYWIIWTVCAGVLVLSLRSMAVAAGKAGNKTE